MCVCVCVRVCVCLCVCVSVCLCVCVFYYWHLKVNLYTPTDQMAASHQNPNNPLEEAVSEMVAVDVINGD